MQKPATHDTRRAGSRVRPAMAIAVFALAALAPACQVQSDVQMNPEPELGCRLAGAESYPAGGPAELEFELENRSERTLWALKWNTPLEGILNRIFRVTRDGEEVEYQGLMARRGEPTAEEYVQIEPGESATARFDLAASYDLGRPGDYRLALVSRIHDLAWDREQIPRPTDEHRPAELECNEIAFRIEG